MSTPNIVPSPLHRDQAFILMKLSSASHRLAMGQGDPHELRTEFLAVLNEAGAVARQMGETCMKVSLGVLNPTGITHSSVDQRLCEDSTGLSQETLDTYVESLVESGICAPQGCSDTGVSCKKGNMYITPENLFLADYMQYPDPFKRTEVKGCYQKTIRSADGLLKLYFIDFTFWSIPQDVRPIRVEIDVHLFQKTGPGFKMEMSPDPGMTIEAVEAFFANTYSKLGCEPDRHNN